MVFNFGRVSVWILFRTTIQLDKVGEFKDNLYLGKKLKTNNIIHPNINYGDLNTVNYCELIYTHTF